LLLTNPFGCYASCQLLCAYTTFHWLLVTEFFWESKERQQDQNALASSLLPCKCWHNTCLAQDFGVSFSSQRQISDSFQAISSITRSSSSPADFKTFRYFLSCFTNKGNAEKVFFTLNYRSSNHNFCMEVFISLTQTAILNWAARLNPKRGKCSQVPS